MPGFSLCMYHSIASLKAHWIHCKTHYVWQKYMVTRTHTHHIYVHILFTTIEWHNCIPNVRGKIAYVSTFQCRLAGTPVHKTFWWYTVILQKDSSVTKLPSSCIEGGAYVSFVSFRALSSLLTLTASLTHAH